MGALTSFFSLVVVVVVSVALLQGGSAFDVSSAQAAQRQQRRRVLSLGAAVQRRRTGSSFLSEETLERAAKGNKVEKAKLAKDPTAAWTDLYDYAAQIRAGTLDWSEIESGDANVRLKWAGLLSRFKKSPGTFMLRARTPNGVTTAKAMRLFHEALEECGGVADITTRQNWQLRNLSLAQGADLVEKLATKANVTTYQSAMDNVRNIVGSPLAGIDQNELVDTRPYCDALNDLITLDPDTGLRGNPTWGNLPRKFNIALSSNAHDYAHARINDLAFEPAFFPPQEDGGDATPLLGFNVVVGGYFSARRSVHAVDLDLWIPATVGNVLDVATTVLAVFRDEGARGDRQKARLMWLVEDYGGVEKFRERILKEVAIPGAARKQSLPPPGGEARLETVGVFPTTEEGRWRVGLHVPVGRVLAKEMGALADLAEKYGDGEMRLTVEQNVMFPSVADPVALLAEAEKTLPNFSLKPGAVSGNTVSCTGAQFCPVAIIETKGFAKEISEMLDERIGRPLRLHVTGCPNSCGQVQLADVGLMGAPARRVDPVTGKAKAVPGCNIFIGGTIGRDSHLVTEPVATGVPIDDKAQLVDTLVTLVDKYLPQRKKDE